MAKAKWPKPPIYQVPLFNCGDIVLLRKREEANDYFTKLGLEFDLTGFNGFAYTYLDAGKPPLFLIGVFLHEAQILAHEACHTAFEICNHVGVPTPNDSQNETFCYLVQRIMDEFTPFINKE